MTEMITNTNTAPASDHEAKALLVRLAIENRYRSPNGGYVSTLNKTAAEIDVGAVSAKISSNALNK
ncbi:MAG: hypothetical protein U0103_16840 [Candidatus Obscuribacterales bacterium]